jgi:hypothetical protein
MFGVVARNVVKEPFSQPCTNLSVVHLSWHGTCMHAPITSQKLLEKGFTGPPGHSDSPSLFAIQHRDNLVVVWEV